MNVSEILRFHVFESGLANAKLRPPEAKWARFHGVTLLFEPQDQELLVRGKLAFVNCTEAANPFYRGLVQLLAPHIPELVGSCAMSMLPYRAYHVTFADLVVQDEVSDLNVNHREAWSAYVDQITAAILRPPPSPTIPESIDDLPCLTLGFADFAIFGSALVARLRPVNEDAEVALVEIDRRRSELYAAWAGDFGRPKPSFQWSPHVSLAYAPNPQLAESAQGLLKRISPTVARALNGQSVQFDSAGLYGFDRMDRFFRKPRRSAAYR